LWFALDSLARALLSVSFGTNQSDDFTHNLVNECYRDFSPVVQDLGTILVADSESKALRKNVARLPA